MQQPAIPWLTVSGKFRIVPRADDVPSIGMVRQIISIETKHLSTPSGSLVPGYRITTAPAFPNVANIDVSYGNGAVFTVINGKTYELLGVSGGGSRRGRKMKRRTIRAVRTMRKMKKMN